MLYCPECKVLAFDTDVEVCPDCGWVMLPLDDLTGEELAHQVVLTQCDTPYEAMLLRTKLDAEGIPAIVEDEQLLQIFTGHGGIDPQRMRVSIRLGDADAALEILRQVRSGELAITENDELPEMEAEGVEPEGDDHAGPAWDPDTTDRDP